MKAGRTGNMTMNNINIVEGILSGAPTIVGTRLTVFNVVSNIYYEDSLEVALEEYELDLRIAREAVNYCSNLICQADKRLIKFL